MKARYIVGGLILAIVLIMISHWTSLIVFEYIGGVFFFALCTIPLIGVFGWAFIELRKLYKKWKQ